jgi:hypothetical protein
MFPTRCRKCYVTTHSVMAVSVAVALLLMLTLPLSAQVGSAGGCQVGGAGAGAVRLHAQALEVTPK